MTTGSSRSTWRCARMRWSFRWHWNVLRFRRSALLNSNSSPSARDDIHEESWSVCSFCVAQRTLYPADQLSCLWSMHSAYISLDSFSHVQREKAPCIANHGKQNEIVESLRNVTRLLINFELHELLYSQSQSIFHCMPPDQDCRHITPFSNRRDHDFSYISCLAWVQRLYNLRV